MIKYINYLLDRPTLNRWFDIFALSMFSSVITFFLYPKLFKFLDSNKWLSVENVHIHGIQNVLIIILATISLIKIGALHPNFKLKTIIKYPPSWVSALFSIIFMSSISVFAYHEKYGIPKSAFEEIFWLSWVIILNSCLVSIVAWCLFAAFARVMYNLGVVKSKIDLKFVLTNLLFWTLACSASIILSVVFAELVLPGVIEKHHAVFKLEFEYWETIYPVLSVNIGILFAFVLSLLSEQKVKDLAPITSQQGSIFSDENVLMNWLLKERSILLPNEDMFGYEIIANRVASMLLNNRTTSIGLIGAYGIGKSSIINMIKHYLNNPHAIKSNLDFSQINKEILICSVDGWGLSSKVVAKNILELVLDELRSHIDCLSIIGLPENYRKTLSGSKSIVGDFVGDFVSPILETTHSAISLLNRLNNILSAANIKVIIFLEDLDRNSSDEIIRDEVPSLLDKLKGLDSFSFVLAIGLERQYSDFVIRICEHTENI